MVVLSNGNVAAAGEGSSTGSTYTVATVDWILGTTGAFQYHESVGSKVAKYSTVFSAPLATDSSNDVFWLATQTDTATKVATEDIGKYSPTGAMDWYRAIPGSASGQLVYAADDGGMFVSYIASAKRWFNRVSAAGAVLWSVAPATGLNEVAGQIVPDALDDLSYMTGYNDAYGKRYFGLLSLNAAKGAVLVNGYETPTGDRSNAINYADQDSFGNAYVTGVENRGWYVAKLSPSGAVVWRKTIGQTVATTPAGPGCICYSNGEVAVAGTGGPDPQSLIVASFNAATGTQNWVTTEPSTSSYTVPESIKIDPSGNVDVGLTNYIASYGVMQINGITGQLKWKNVQTADAPMGNIAVDAQGNIFLAGSFWYSQSPSTALTKLSKSGAVAFSKIEYYGKGPFVTAIQCDPSTGDVFLESSDSSTVGSTTVGMVDIGRYDPSGNQIWFSSIPTTGYGYTGLSDARFRSANGLLYVVTQLATSLGSSVDYGVECVNGSTGKVDWQKVFNVPYNQVGSVPTPWVLDQYGDVIFTSPVPSAQRVLDRFQTIKLDAATGATRFQTTYQGAFASTFNYPTAVTVGPDDQPLILGETACPYGPGSNDSFVIKCADAHGPICVNDAYTCLENTSLPSTDPSVFANDRDIAGAVCHLVSGPTHAKAFSLSTSGKITYTPAANFKGTDTFTYDASNAYGTSNVATVTITVK
jgi:hypothetical protein